MIILFGLAGSGKSTQGRAIAEMSGRKWLSVGQVLRDTGCFDEIIQRGELVDDATVIDLMQNELEKADLDGQGVVADGYPRDEVQAAWLVENALEDLEVAVYLEVPKDELFRRLALRGRADDTRDVVEKRFNITEQNICSILSLLEGKGVPVLRVDGTGTREEVTERLKEELAQWM